MSAGSTAIKSFEFARRGGSFLVNCADRIIRVYSQDTVMSVREGEDPEPEQKLQDLVNRYLGCKHILRVVVVYICVFWCDGIVYKCTG